MQGLAKAGRPRAVGAAADAPPCAPRAPQSTAPSPTRARPRAARCPARWRLGQAAGRAPATHMRFRRAAPLAPTPCARGASHRPPRRPRGLAATAPGARAAPLGGAGARGGGFRVTARRLHCASPPGPAPRATRWAAHAPAAPRAGPSQPLGWRPHTPVAPLRLPQVALHDAPLAVVWRASSPGRPCAPADAPSPSSAAPLPGTTPGPA